MKKKSLIPAAFLFSVFLMGGVAVSMDNPIENENILPGWLVTKIRDMQKAPRANPPAELWKCSYQEKTAYYIPPRCCDIFSNLYDAEGKLLCHPGGGITGKGDGKCKDFTFNKDACELIWKDNR